MESKRRPPMQAKFNTKQAMRIARDINITDYAASLEMKKMIETMYPGATPALVQSTMCHVAYEMGRAAKKKYAAERAVPATRAITVPVREEAPACTSCQYFVQQAEVLRGCPMRIEMHSGHCAYQGSKDRTF